MNKLERGRVLRKISAKPMPISYDIVFDFAEKFTENFLDNILKAKASPFQYFQIAHKLNPVKAEILSGFYQVYNLVDVAGNDKKIMISAVINGNEKSSARYNRGSNMGEVIEINMGNDIIDATLAAVSNAVINKGLTSADLTPIILNQIEDYITQAVIHELTHATDVIPANKRVEKEYKQDGFYYASREEIKSHINETVYEVGSKLAELDPSTISQISFMSFLEKNSNVYKQLKNELEIKPGDENIAVPGGNLAKKKRNAWKKYLLAIYEWWTKQVERIANTPEKKLARRKRQNVLDPILSQLMRGK